MFPDLGAILETVAKYAFAAALASAAVLFLPEPIIQNMGLAGLREAYRGFWWLVLIFCSLLSAQIALKHLWGVAQTALSARGQRRRVREADERAHREEELRLQRAKEEEALAADRRRRMIDARLSGLSPGEREVVTFCLLRGQQSVTSYIGYAPVDGLVTKELLLQGRGTLMDLTHIFPDDVWSMLLERSKEFLADEPIVKKVSSEAYERFMRRPYG